MKKHVSKFVITEAGIEHNFRAEIYETESGFCNIEIIRIFKDGEEQKRTPNDGVDRINLRLAKSYVREAINKSFGKQHDLRLIWTQEPFEKVE